MDAAIQQWKILQGLDTYLARRVREFMVIGSDGDGVIVVTEDGQAFWFGKNWFGSKTSHKQTPLNVPDIVQMAQSYCHILLLNKRGEIYSMGENDCGQLGLGTVDGETHFSPQLIPSQHKFISVRCGIRYSVALTEDGKVWAWGLSEFGQAGEHGSSITISSPNQISKPNLHRIVSIECGGQHSLALTDQGEVYGWGKNDKGQLGNESESYQPTPTKISTPSPVQSMAAGSHHTLLLNRTGEVWACGWNRHGQLGLPISTKFSASLVKVAGLPTITQIASHFNSLLSIAMSTEQRCFVWGLVGGGTHIFPLELSLFYSTVESPLSFYSSFDRNTPHSVTIQETLQGRLLRSVGLSRMFDNPESSPDVQFVVEQRTIHAHRNILSNSSDYFARMFSERWRVPVDPEDPIVRVTITDHSYQVVHALLRFLYTGSFEVLPNLLPEIFELANLYLVPDLKQLCISRMRTTITPATFCLYYPLTQRHSLLRELATFQQELVQFARMSEVDTDNSAAYQSMEPYLRDNLTNAAQNFPGN